MAFLLQCLHTRSSKRIHGLVYRPVSIARGMQVTALNFCKSAVLIPSYMRKNVESNVEKMLFQRFMIVEKENIKPKC